MTLTPEQARRQLDHEDGWSLDDEILAGKSVSELERRLSERPGEYIESTVDRKHRYPLERGWTKHQLIHELAAQDTTIAYLARKYGVGSPGIINFRTRHMAEILAVQQNLADKFASIPLARKENRLAEYQQDVEDINALQADVPTPELTRIKHGALKNIAEEMGHLPSKTAVQVNNAQVTYVVEGVDTNDLR